MATSFVDEEQFDNDPSANTLNELDDFESKQAPQSTQVEQETEDDIPDKYKNKTAKQIAQMHMEAEKLIGRQAQEVHQVRSLADNLIKQQLNNAPTKQAESIQSSNSDIDFFENPQQAIRNAVESDPSVKEARLATQQFKAMQAQASLNQKHPDFPSIVAEPEFQQWVEQSAIRKQLLQQADQGFDVNAADELFTTYKQIKQARQQTVSNNSTEMRTQTLKAAQVDSGGTGETSKKIYRRQDILEMMHKQPERYYSDSIQNELMKAYAEKRVR